MVSRRKGTIGPAQLTRSGDRYALWPDNAVVTIHDPASSETLVE
jgi:hypothetical protein